jgi:hypothetical protein
VGQEKGPAGLGTHHCPETGQVRLLPSFLFELPSLDANHVIRLTWEVEQKRSSVSDLMVLKENSELIVVWLTCGVVGSALGLCIYCCCRYWLYAAPSCGMLV